ncbi:FHA domain-containing protein [Blautia massiliensis (ex Liu et al. 2021)]|uniref:FHA domain-containing protein n=1 Tax=Blautia massiliensis (ex Liu et al. 2021) TaxID=3062492 RepID=UPI003F8B16FA
MELKKKKIMAAIAAVFWCVLLSITPVFAAGDDYRIEQLYINMPDVTAYYRSSQGDSDLEAYLGGEKLSLKDVENFEKTGEAVEYYILVDISSSLPQERFVDIKAALTQFHSELRENDSMVLITFGNEVKQILNGTEDQDTAAAAISALNNDNGNTVLFDAINTAADMIWKEGASSEKRRIITVISDGKDCADDTRSAESTESTLKSRGIPIYTMAMENIEGDSEVETQNYRGKFAAMARDTGGVPWTVSSGQNTLDGLHTIRDAVMSSYRARFTASSNRVSNKKEDFVLKFLSAGNMSDTCSVLVSRGQKDDTAPEIQSIESKKANSISITFSKPVENAKEAGNYSVTRDGEAVPVKQVVAGENSATEITLLFDEDLYEADYVIKLKNITDQSNEKNALVQNEIKLSTDWPKPKASVIEMILKWWPLVLTAVFVILIVVVVIVLRNIRKKKNVLIIDDQVVRADEVEERKHIRMDQTAGKNIVISISNGRDMPKRMEYVLKGSAIIGRAAECDIYCDDPMMSKQHFALEDMNGNIFIYDLQSKNGTRVNGMPVKEKYPLHSGDEIKAGNLKFRIEWNQGGKKV